MSAPAILAVGRYDPAALAAMAEIAEVLQVAEGAQVGALPAATRDRVAAAATHAFARLDADAIAALPNLQVIANFGVGYDNVDVGAASARGIAVTNTPDVLTDDVADLAVGMLIALTRGIVAGDGHVRTGAWAAQGPMALTRSLRGRRVGILGLGRIGRAIAERLAAFGIDIHYAARTAKDTPGWTVHADAQALAAAVDDLVVALVGGPETARIVSAEVIDALGPDGQVVNIARGSCVDESALIAALEAGRLRGAALDVFEGEPGIDPRFAALPNVLLQPHQASATVETRAAMGRLQRDNLAAFFAGRPLPTQVN